MDPFSKLPSLVQTEIFVHLQSDINIKQVIRASPYMLWHFVTYKKSVIRRVLNNIVPLSTSGDIIRDALRIIDISDKATAKRYNDTDLSQDMKLPDNLTDEQLRTLWLLFIRIIPFIEDYISKATSVYPPRAYIGIPDVRDGSGSYFEWQRLETNIVKFTSLTSAERHRFLSAFMRYELFCKIFPPRVHNYEEQLARGRRLATMCRGSDWRILLSVHEYYGTVYGALFAHGANSWLPDIPELSKTVHSVPSEYGLLFPDNIYLDAGEYETDLDTNGRTLAHVLPCFGLDCLTQILLYVRKATWHKLILKTWLRTSSIFYWHDWKPWIEWLPNSLTDEEIRSYDQPRTYQPGQGRNVINRGTVITYKPGNLRHQTVKRIQVSTYRQRAWGLFDDDRLYPKHTHHFPTFSQLYRMQTEFEEKGSRGRLERKHRRSQKWQDYWASDIQPTLRLNNAADADVDTIVGHLGPCVRCFSAPNEKLPNNLTEY
ncbi:hypothetical protein FPHYL_12146 [Fusarium phyllophilum]|uniref:Uncharacterized protein n=1 Tax=Fusarium phyllophilum TaxID=47803 RepID=A0A8H5MRT1_9HYPO|nr:hypothetical protein FPHYL_12146 [Fusarium phyllophilum]